MKLKVETVKVDDNWSNVRIVNTATNEPLSDCRTKKCPTRLAEGIADDVRQRLEDKTTVHSGKSDEDRARSIMSERLGSASA